MNKVLTIGRFCLFCFLLGFCVSNKPVSPYGEMSFGSQFVVEHIMQPADLVGSIPSDVTMVINVIKHPERFRRVGAPLPKGILMIGPPGVGKTTMARYIAYEADCDIIIASAAKFINRYVGTGPDAVNSLFETARRHLQAARFGEQQKESKNSRGFIGQWFNRDDDLDDDDYACQNSNSGQKGEVPGQKPVIIFIDEIDSIGATRGSFAGCGMEERNTLNQLFTEMEGIHGCDNIIVIAASNEDERFFDPGLLSRFSYIAHVPLPDEQDRLKILHHFAGKGMFASDASLDYLSGDTYTRGYAGRDLKKLVENIARIAANDMSFANDEVVITQNHIQQGYREFNERKRREIAACRA